LLAIPTFLTESGQISLVICKVQTIHYIVEEEKREMAPSAKSKKSSKATAPKKRATNVKDSVTTTNKADAKVVGSGASLGEYDVTIGTACIN
jgi:hypothetical protein